MSVQNDKKILSLTLNTWPNDTYGIYDYSTDTIKTILVNIEESVFITRTKNNIFREIFQHAYIEEEDDLIFYVNNESDNEFSLINPIPYNLKYNSDNCSYLNNKLWYVVKSDELEKSKNNDEEYYLNENDIIKLGKVKYVVKKINIQSRDNSYESEAPIAIKEIKYDISNSNKNDHPVLDFVFDVKSYSNYKDINEKIKKNDENPDDDEENNICKYCNNNHINPETDDGEPNPLISLCKCKNKEDLVHFKCMKNEILKRIEKRNDSENRILIDDSKTILDFGCEKCGEQYPLKFKLENIDKIFSLYDYEEPKNCDYMVLESLDYKKDEKYVKSIHIIKLINEYITIGRENENDISDKDISISRNHAIIRFNKENGTICLQNRSKKFGTLVLVREPIKILEKTIYLQVGRTFIEAKLIDRKKSEKKEKDEIKVDKNNDNNKK